MRVGEGGVEGETLRLRRLSCACRGWLAEGEGSPGLPPILEAGRNRAGTQGQQWQLWPRVVGRRRGSPFVCLLMLLVATSPSYRVGISFCLRPRYMWPFGVDFSPPTPWCKLRGVAARQGAKLSRRRARPSPVAGRGCRVLAGVSELAMAPQLCPLLAPAGDHAFF